MRLPLTAIDQMVAVHPALPNTFRDSQTILVQPEKVELSPGVWGYEEGSTPVLTVGTTDQYNQDIKVGNGGRIDFVAPRGLSGDTDAGLRQNIKMGSIEIVKADSGDEDRQGRAIIKVVDENGDEVIVFDSTANGSSVPAIGFWAELEANQAAPGSTVTQTLVDYETVNYPVGTETYFDDATGKFTAPQDGFYSFDAAFSVLAAGSNVNCEAVLRVTSDPSGTPTTADYRFFIHNFETAHSSSGNVKVPMLAEETAELTLVSWDAGSGTISAAYFSGCLIR
jgi:hypothetical protein